MFPTSKPLLLAALLLAGAGCKTIVVNVAADSLGGDSSAFATDDDPELVGAAIPFGLKTIESLLDSSPENEKLLLAAASGYTQYAYAFVQQKADFVEEKDPAASRELRARARKLFRRARDYGLRGLEVRHPGFGDGLTRDRPALMAKMEKEDVPFLYWTGASWGALISLTKTDAELLGHLPQMEALMQRALALDPDWGDGSLHEFFVTYDGGRSEAVGGSLKRAKEHYDRVLALSSGKKIGVMVTWAEVVAVQAQDRKTFDEMLRKVMDFDANEAPRFRLVNTIAQQRARWLSTRAGDLFLED